jgi:hypothetical protein
MGRRTSRKSVASARGEGLRDERKALALRYTIDADEAMRREVFAAESRLEPAEPAESQAHAGRTPAPESRARESTSARYVIQLNAIRFWWRWTLFEDLSVGDDPVLALRSAEAVATSSLPYWSARSARRAAERAAFQASRGAKSLG